MGAVQSLPEGTRIPTPPPAASPAVPKTGWVKLDNAVYLLGFALSILVLSSKRGDDDIPDVATFDDDSANSKWTYTKYCAIALLTTITIGVASKLFSQNSH